MTLEATAPLPQLNAHALLIQIAKYPTRPLPEVHDAADVAAVLQDPELCGYPPAQVKLLPDDQATRDAIVEEVRRLVAAADEDATVLFYFSGHGGQLGETTYLLPIDTDPKQIGATALSAEDLAHELAPLRARKTLLIFDCCHAGGFEAKNAPAEEVEGLQPWLPTSAQEVLLQGRGWALFAASDAEERSFVRLGERNGVFSKHLLAGLRGARPSEDGYVRVFDLFEYLQPRVTAEAPMQHPVFKCSLNENFAIARHRGGASGTVPRTKDDYLYDALLSYAKADAGFVRDTLLPRLRAAKLRVATTSNVGEPGLDRVIGLERGLKQARRTLVIVSQAFLRRDGEDAKFADHLVLQGKHADIATGRYSLVPIYVEDPDSLDELPGWLSSLTGVRLGEAAGGDADDELERLVKALSRPVPQR